MTAPEQTRPAAEHIDAVARTMQPGAWKFSAAMSKERARIDARRLLTSTDPAVHLALADALVRAGVLVRTTITANNATVSILAERIEVAP